MDLLKGRNGDGSRPWSAGAGATVTTIGLAIVTYTLAQLRPRLGQVRAMVDWRSPPTEPGDVLFFEAFVSQGAKGGDHTEDARLAAEAARALIGTIPADSAIDEAEVFSTLGAALLRTGWSVDLGLLSTPCLVVKPA